MNLMVNKFCSFCDYMSHTEFASPRPNAIDMFAIAVFFMFGNL